MVWILKSKIIDSNKRRQWWANKARIDVGTKNSFSFKSCVVRRDVPPFRMPITMAKLQPALWVDWKRGIRVTFWAFSVKMYVIYILTTSCRANCLLSYVSNTFFQLTLTIVLSHLLDNLSYPRWMKWHLNFGN